MIEVDQYVFDVLMRDLVGHDRAPSAFLVYLHLWRLSGSVPGSKVPVSLQTIAESTGLSKSAVQNAMRRLLARRLVSSHKHSPTAIPEYRVLRPWRR